MDNRIDAGMTLRVPRCSTWVERELVWKFAAVACHSLNSSLQREAPPDGSIPWPKTGHRLTHLKRRKATLLLFIGLSACETPSNSTRNVALIGTSSTADSLATRLIPLQRQLIAALNDRDGGALAELIAPSFSWPAVSGPSIPYSDRAEDSVSFLSLLAGSKTLRISEQPSSVRVDSLFPGIAVVRSRMKAGRGFDVTWQLRPEGWRAAQARMVH